MRYLPLSKYNYCKNYRDNLEKKLLDQLKYVLIASHLYFLGIILGVETSGRLTTLEMLDMAVRRIDPETPIRPGIYKE